MNYQKLQEFRAMLLLSNNTVYIMKIIGKVNVDDPQSYLQKVDSKSMTHLKYVTVLYARQGIQIEFVVKGKPTIYNILIRDSEICQDFMTSFVGKRILSYLFRIRYGSAMMSIRY